MDESLSSSPVVENFKISAFTKYNNIRNNIGNVTIGPNSVTCDKFEVVKSEPIYINHNDSPKSIVRDSINHLEAFERIEIERQNIVKDKIRSRVKAIEEFTRKKELDSNQQLLKSHQCILNSRQRQENDILQFISECNKKNDSEHAKLAQQQQKQRQHQEELEAARQEQKRNIERIAKCQEEFKIIYKQILEKCSNNQELITLMGEDFKLLKKLNDNLLEITKKCKNFRISEEDIRKTSELLVQVTDLRTKFESGVEKINKQKQEESQRRDELQKQVELQKQSPVSSVPASTIITEVRESASIALTYPVKDKQPQKTIKSSPEYSSISRYVSITNLKMYTDINTFLEEHTLKFKQLQEDPTLKQFKFDCKKAINIPVNSLSGINAEHIQDKYNRLYNLLKGKDVIVSDKRINASKHPQGIAFCMDLLAKKFVLQGDLMVSSNPESAFCYATVIVSLWNEFPIFGQLLLGYFYKECPFLVPFCIPKQVGESDEMFYLRQGYQYSEGNIEKQDRYLRRMIGIMRLYSAILIVKPKSGQCNTPHNLAQGWRWISSLLKLEPQVDITATMLHTFLEMTGFEFDTRYGIVFQKLLRKIIIEKFLPSIREKCTGGAVTRLELLLNDYLKNNKFDQPPGYLANSYW